MNKKNFFESMYNDFFGLEKIKRENEKLKEELNINEEDIPFIDVHNEEQENIDLGTETEEVPKSARTKEEKDTKQMEFIKKIDEFNLSEENKNTLKKMIEYMRKFNEKLEKEFIPFNIILYSKDEIETNEIAKLLFDSICYFEYIYPAKDIVEANLYKIEKLEQIDEIYQSKNAVIIFKGIDAISAQDSNFKDKFWNRVEEYLKENNKHITIINCKNKDSLELALDKNAFIKEKYFDFEITVEKPQVQDVYQEVLENLQKNNKVSEKFIVELLEYIETTYPNTTLSHTEYITKLCQKILFNKKEEITENDIPKYDKEKTIDEIFKELNSLVGLKQVKQVLQDLVSLQDFKSKAGDSVKVKSTNLHMVFLGNPGTGKTTVARMVAGILYNLKYIKQNKLIEVSSKDLVAEYVGQTAPKTMAVVEKALGGVLFIDEAYSLASGHGQGNSYNEEAIATLIQAMENNRDNLVVIFAGYTKEMQDFLNSNSGIVSRIGYTLEFADYTETELLEIFKSMITGAGFEITKEALNKVLQTIKEYTNTKNFGNARFVRNLYEKTIIKHASNTKNKKQKKLLKTIQEEDISTENLLKM